MFPKVIVEVKRADTCTVLRTVPGTRQLQLLLLKLLLLCL